MSESTRHRRAFETYWRLGADRSIERLRQAIEANDGKAPSMRTLYAWSGRHKWQFRIAELEREARIADDAARIQEVRDMAERHAKTGLYLQQTGMEWLVDIDHEVVTPEAAVRAIIEGARLERLARGEPTERQNVKGEIDAKLAILTDAQLTQLIRIAENPTDGDVSSKSE